jgi:hypothetical protein
MASPTGNRHDAPSALDLIAFFDVAVIAQKHHAHLIFFQVERQTDSLRTEFHQLAGHDVFQAVNARDTVTHADHRPRFADVGHRIEIFNLGLQHTRDFICSNLSHTVPNPSKKF